MVPACCVRLLVRVLAATLQLNFPRMLIRKAAEALGGIPGPWLLLTQVIGRVNQQMEDAFLSVTHLPNESTSN